MLTTVGLFSGIGGFEQGFVRQGFQTTLLCESALDAQHVLRARFPGVPLAQDIRKLRSIPKADVVTAGFPCQDLSQAGRTRGIQGRNSSLVFEIFRLLRAGSRPNWVVLENVPFMLNLNGGQAMRTVIRALTDLKYAWAYRIVDARAYGLPQRRRRVLIVASRNDDPRPALLAQDEPDRSAEEDTASAFGFYWTEGNKGLGWAPDSIPALKSGSAVCIPSAPAVWIPSRRLVGTPDIRDAERLQGFRTNWTRVSTSGGYLGRSRWRLIGNAMPVPIAEWLAKRIQLGSGKLPEGERVAWNSPWGNAGWGFNGHRYGSTLGEWPIRRLAAPIAEFLRYPAKPLSQRATSGFVGRLERSTLRFRRDFLRDLRAHARAVDDR